MKSNLFEKTVVVPGTAHNEVKTRLLTSLIRKTLVTDMSADFVLRVFVSDLKNLPCTGETCHQKALGNDWLDITCINDLCLTFKIKHIIITFFCVFLSQFCSLFFGSVLPPSSQMATQPVTSQEVLASDSEDDSQVE